MCGLPSSRIARPFIAHDYRTKPANKQARAKNRTGTKAGIHPQHATRIRLILAQLQQARTIDDLGITFRFTAGDAEVVDYEDYH
jgi:hypothetical protein